MNARTVDRRALAKGLWPDKLLFATILLFATGVVGALHALADLAIGIDYGRDLPNYLQPGPAWVVSLSALAAVLAFVALREHLLWLAFAGAGAGALSMAMLGVGSILSLLAAGLLLLSRAEGEDANVDTARLTNDMWPDKALAASIVTFLGAAAAVAWGVALSLDAFSLGGIRPDLLGPVSIVAGLLGLGAAWLLYHQKALWLGVLANVVIAATMALFVVGPLAGLAALILLYGAWREDEFSPAAAPA